MYSPAPFLKVAMFCCAPAPERRRDEIAAQHHSQRSKEFASGTIGPGMGPEEAAEKHGPYWNAVRAFGLVQGTTEDGTPEVRRIDDHTESGNNQRLQSASGHPVG